MGVEKENQIIKGKPDERRLKLIKETIINS